MILPGATTSKDRSSSTMDPTLALAPTMTGASAAVLALHRHLRLRRGLGTLAGSTLIRTPLLTILADSSAHRARQHATRTGAHRGPEKMTTVIAIRVLGSGIRLQRGEVECGAPAPKAKRSWSEASGTARRGCTSTLAARAATTPSVKTAATWTRLSPPRAKGLSIPMPGSYILWFRRRSPCAYCPCSYAGFASLRNWRATCIQTVFVPHRHISHRTPSMLFPIRTHAACFRDIVTRAWIRRSSLT